MTTKSLLDRIGKNRVTNLMVQAVQDAVKDSLKQGVPVIGLLNDELVQLDSNGEITQLKQVPEVDE